MKEQLLQEHIVYLTEQIEARNKIIDEYRDLIESLFKKIKEATSPHTQ